MSVYGFNPGAGFDQLLSTNGGATVVSSPPMKNSASAATIAKPKLLSALLNIRAPPDHRRHDVVAERHDPAEDQDAREQSHHPDGMQGDDRVDERDRRIVPLPALPEPAEPQRHEEPETADHHQ